MLVSGITGMYTCGALAFLHSCIENLLLAASYKYLCVLATRVAPKAADDGIIAAPPGSDDPSGVLIEKRTSRNPEPR